MTDESVPADTQEIRAEVPFPTSSKRPRRWRFVEGALGLNSNDPRVPSVLDLDELTKLLVGKTGDTGAGHAAGKQGN